MSIEFDDKNHSNAITLELNIIEKRKIRKLTSAHIMWCSVILFFLLIGMLYNELIVPNRFIGLLMFVLALMPIATNVYGNYEYFPENFHVTSNVKFENNKVILYNRELQFKDINRIELNINDWFGKKIITNFRAYGSGPKLSRGVNNYIKIYPKDSDLISIRIQLLSNDEFIALGDWIKTLYKTNVLVLEKYDHLRSYGLKHLSYSQIQKFKEDYFKHDSLKR